MQDVLAQLTRGHEPFVPSAMQPYFVTCSITPSGPRAPSRPWPIGSALQVKLALVTVGQNEVVKNLAGWAALVAVPTLVASWYGMNFKHMPELSEPLADPIHISAVGRVVTGLGAFLRCAPRL